MLLRHLISFAVFLSVLAGPGEAFPGEGPKPTEYDVKAAYIYNFAKFVEWPPGTFHDQSEDLDVCVVGEDAFGHSLAAINGKNVGGRKIRVRRSVSLQDLKGCEIVYIGASERERLERILKPLDDNPVLTIGDSKGFTQRGVMINFFIERKKVLFEINPKAAERVSLRISSVLLRIARITGESRE